MAITRTVPLLMLINELNRLKAASGKKDAEAADHLGNQASKINRILLGQSKASVGDAMALARFYGATEEHVEVIADLARKLGKRGDWGGYENVFAESMRLRLDLERASSRMRQYQTEIIPGLLQTEHYIRALHEAPHPFGLTYDVEHAVAARRERQSILHRVDKGKTISFVLSESCLRCLPKADDEKLIREQLAHLTEIAELPNVQLQVLPFNPVSPVTYRALSFTLLHVPGPGIASPLDFAFLEQYNESRYIDKYEQVEAYEQLWGYLQAAALAPKDSIEFIGKVAGEYK